MTSQCNTPIPGEQQQRNWKAAEDHELVTNSEDNEANMMAKFVECKWREVVRKVVEVEQQWKVKEGRAEVQRKKEVSSEHPVHCMVLMRGHDNRNTEPKRLIGWRKQKWRQPARQRRSIRQSWRGNAQRLKGGRGSRQYRRCT